MSKTPPQQQNSSGQAPVENKLHQPVLLDSVLSYLTPTPGETYLDLTAGYGGHAEAVMKLTEDAASMTLVDRDAKAIKALHRFEAIGARLLHSDFLSAAKLLISEGKRFDMILADLGVSSPQLDSADRGFSFKNDGPLDMRMDQRLELTAEDIVNTYQEAQLAELIRQFGEEPKYKRIAQAIVAGRPHHLTASLATIIAGVIPRSRRQKIHPATRTFQALRIALNQELTQVENLLPLLPKLLNTGGRVVIISFHSLEDRLVKRYFAKEAASGYEAELKLLNKKAVRGAISDVSNPRARSATLRAAVKIKIEGA